MASTDLPTTLVQQIASNVLSVAAAAIPLEVVEHTKALIVDSIGCALAATEEPAFARASRVFAQLGGNSDCTVIGSARRVNLLQAVLLNGILIRSLDLNDAYIGPGQMGHPKLIDAYATVGAACSKHGKVLGMGGVYDEENATRYVGMGARFVLTGSDHSYVMMGADARSGFFLGLPRIAEEPGKKKRAKG
jgi:hypothetical protein